MAPASRPGVAVSEPGRELVIVDRRASTRQERAFPRDPGLADPSNGPIGTVGPDSPPTTAALGAEPVIVDGDQLAAALPQPSLTPMPWAGWPSQWQPAWSSGAGVAGSSGLGGKVSTVFSCTALNANALGSMPATLTDRGRPIDGLAEGYEWLDNPEPRLYAGWG